MNRIHACGQQQDPTAQGAAQPKPTLGPKTEDQSYRDLYESDAQAARALQYWLPETRQAFEASAAAAAGRTGLAATAGGGTDDEANGP